MERIKCTDITDTLLKALEKADDMEDVLIIYYAKDGCKGSCFTSEGLKSTDALWLVEQYKCFLPGIEKRD